MMKKRVMSLVMVVILGIVMMPAQAFASTRTVLAMGDSISAGYGLSDPETECFVSILGNSGYISINKAVSGNRAPDIWDQLNNPSNENYISPELIRSADIVTVTCGGNDMMDVLYGETAEIWNAEHPSDPIQADEITSKFTDGMNMDTLELVRIALSLLDSDSDSYLIDRPEFEETLNTYISNLNRISNYIHEINPLAEIIVATQYNPYVEFEGELISVSILISKIEVDLDPLYSGIEDGATKLNNAIKNNAEAGEYTVTDVKAAFDSYSGTGDLYNANIDRSSFIPKVEVDFHPTAAGHALIAECFLTAIAAPRYLKIRDASGAVYSVELPLDTGVTVAAVAYGDNGAMTDILVRICSGRNYTLQTSGSGIKVFFLKTGTFIPTQAGIKIK